MAWRIPTSWNRVRNRDIYYLGHVWAYFPATQLWYNVLNCLLSTLHEFWSSVTVGIARTASWNNIAVGQNGVWMGVIQMYSVCGVILSKSGWVIISTNSQFLSLCIRAMHVDDVLVINFVSWLLLLLVRGNGLSATRTHCPEKTYPKREADPKQLGSKTWKCSVNHNRESPCSSVYSFSTQPGLIRLHTIHEDPRW